MNAFRMYLWKEWREQRAAVLALAIVLPALVLTSSASMPRKFLGDATFTAAVVVLALIASLVSISGELLTRGAPSAWVERLPRGLPASFGAKGIAFACSTALALLAGYGLGLSGTILSGASATGDVADSLHEAERLGGIVVAGIVLACWTFAASAWCSRGMLALGAGAVLAFVLGLPLWMYQWEGYLPRPGEVTGAIVLLVVAALLSAWAGFVHGQRLGRPWWSAASRGGLVGLACAMPLNAWGFLQVHERDRVDLASMEVEHGFAFADGQKVIVSALVDSTRWVEPRFVFLLDLEDGTARRIGERSAYLRWSRRRDQSLLEDPAHVVVHSRRGSIAFEPRDAEPMSAPEAPWDFSPWPAGHGWYSIGTVGMPPSYFDPYRSVTIRAQDLGTRSWPEAYIGPDGWIVRDGGSWFEYLPGGPLVAAPWMDSVHQVTAMLADGRMLAMGRGDDPWVLVDPCRREVLRVQATQEAIGYLHVPYGRRAVDPGPLLLDSLDTDTSGLHRTRFLFDPERLELIRADDSYAGDLLRTLPDGTLLLLTGEGIARRDAATGARTLVFDFANAREVEPLEP